MPGEALVADVAAARVELGLKARWRQNQIAPGCEAIYERPTRDENRN